jgi:hypothetical protein
MRMRVQAQVVMSSVVGKGGSFVIFPLLTFYNSATSAHLTVARIYVVRLSSIVNDVGETIARPVAQSAK